MPVSRLNVDILANVCQLFLMEVTDVLSVSLTCSSMHIVALQGLKSGSSIQRFHSFLFADKPARAPHVRAFNISLAWRKPGPAADDSHLLLNIFASCQSLEHITITIQNAWFNSTVADPRFLPAIAAIPSLRSFTVRGESLNALAIVPDFSKPIHKLGINSSNMPLSSWYPAVLQQFLPRVVIQTLEEFELDQFTVDPDDAMEALAIPPGPVPPILEMMPYSAVRSPSVGPGGVPLPNHLQHLFPALDGTLHLGMLNVHTRHCEEEYASIRAANQRSQETDSGDGGPSRRAWKKLDRIVCDAAMLYVLGLRCPIRLAMIDPGLVHEYDRCLADALRENPVARLKLTLDSDHDLRGLDGLFSPELAGVLTHLTLCYLYSNEYASRPQGDEVQADTAAQRSWDSVLDAIISAIQPLRNLTHLRVVVGASVYVHESATRTWPLAPWQDSEYAHSFRASSFDWEGTAATLARALPSSQNVFLTTGGFLSNWDGPADMEDMRGGPWKPYERWYVTHGWRIANRDAGGTAGSDGAREGEPERALVELRGDVAETIMRNEELVLSRSDEAALHLNYAGWGRTPPPLSV